MTETGRERLAGELAEAADGAIASARMLVENNVGLVKTCRQLHNDLRRTVELLDKVMETAEPVFLAQGFEPDEYVIPVDVYEEVCEYLADYAARQAAAKEG